MMALINYIAKLLCCYSLICIPLSSYAQSLAKKAYSEVKAGKAVFIDVREKSELSSGWVKSALWLPMSQAGKGAWFTNIKELSKNKKIYLYCRSGSRAGSLQRVLAQKGVEVENLGGFRSLQDQDIPSHSKDPKCSLSEKACI